MTQKKNDSINSILKHGRVVDNNCCVVFLSHSHLKVQPFTNTRLPHLFQGHPNS